MAPGEPATLSRIARSSAWFPVAMIALALGGCDPGDGLDRQPIQGTITLDGQPLAEGAILFEPASNESGTAVGTTIHAGAFSIPRAAGPVPGPYWVRVYAASTVQAPPAPGQSPRASRPMVERIPERYNTHTTLKFTVSRGQANNFRLALESMGSQPGP